MNKNSKLERHISILKTAIKKGFVYESHDWIRTDDRNIHIVEFVIKIGGNKA